MILIVDDKPENLFSLRALLQLHHYEVETASTGEEALTKVLRNEYALIILDVQMPEMDGYEVAEAITGFSKTRSIPIIFLSAVNIDKRFIAKGYESGGVDYVTKPFDADLLILKVKTFVKLYEQAKELKRIGTALEQANHTLEEKVAERTAELVEINRELEQNNIELQQYASVASHDLQEPLRKIITFAGIITDRFISEDHAAAVYLQKVVASAQRMRNLITDLLSYSKLSSELHFEPVKLEEIIHETLHDLELSIAEKNAQVNVGSLPVIDAISGQIRQVFQNIISNALKFSVEGGRPIISISAVRIAAADFAAPEDPEGAFVRITVVDNGIGFNEEYLNKIFGLFQRLHHRDKFEGTGIGLAIVKKIVDKHHGLITAESEEGYGAKFIIVLPVSQNGIRQSINKQTSRNEHV